MCRRNILRLKILPLLMKNITVLRKLKTIDKKLRVIFNIGITGGCILDMGTK
jgi:hypothetical protein